MGYEQRHALVSMTNKDVYYVSKQTAKLLMVRMASPASWDASFETTDAKNGSEISITIANISSVVIPKEGGNRG